MHAIEQLDVLHIIALKLKMQFRNVKEAHCAKADQQEETGADEQINYAHYKSPLLMYDK